MRASKFVLFALLAALVPALMAPSGGGFPSQPTFQAATINGSLRVGSSAATNSTSPLNSVAADNQIDLYNPSGAVDEKHATWRHTGHNFCLSLWSDSFGTNSNPLCLTQAGTVVSSIDFTGTALTLNGTALPTSTTTTSTATITGCTTAPTTTVRLSKIGAMATIGVDGLTCTSNTTALTLTGAIPAAFQTTRTMCGTFPNSDNSVSQIGTICLAPASGTLTFGTNTSTGNFTAAGVKGVAVTNSGGTSTWSYLTN